MLNYLKGQWIATNMFLFSLDENAELCRIIYFNPIERASSNNSFGFFSPMIAMVVRFCFYLACISLL